MTSKFSPALLMCTFVRLPSHMTRLPTTTLSLLISNQLNYASHYCLSFLASITSLHLLTFSPLSIPTTLMSAFFISLFQRWDLPPWMESYIQDSGEKLVSNMQRQHFSSSEKTTPRRWAEELSYIQAYNKESRPCEHQNQVSR